MMASACTPAKHPGEGKWEYDVTFPANDDGDVLVEAVFEEVGVGTFRFRDEIDSIVNQVEGPFVRSAGAWLAESCVHACRVRYSVNVRRALAACNDDLGCGVQARGAVVAPITTWLLRPSPKRDVPTYLRIHGTAISAVGAGKKGTLRSIDLDEGSFTAFGNVRSSKIGRVPVVSVGTSEGVSRGTKNGGFVERAIRRAENLFGKVPAEHPVIFLLSTDSDHARGKTMALSGASIALDVGSKRDPTEERVLLHEVAHLALPTFRGEGRWLGEGFAVYFESLMRARAHDWSEDDFVAWVQSIALEAPATGSLLTATDDESIYAGGALFALAVDIELHAKCKSLEGAVRGAMERGVNATMVMALNDYVAMVDREVGETIASGMLQRASDLASMTDRRTLLSSAAGPRLHAIFSGSPRGYEGCR